MISTSANFVVMIMFGLLVGITLQVNIVITQAAQESKVKVPLRDRLVGANVRHLPKSYWLGIVVVYVPIFLLILLTTRTGFRMMWIPFVIGNLAGTAAAIGVFRSSGRHRGSSDMEPKQML